MKVKQKNWAHHLSCVLIPKQRHPRQRYEHLERPEEINLEQALQERGQDQPGPHASGLEQLHKRELVFQ